MSKKQNRLENLRAKPNKHNIIAQIKVLLTQAPLPLRRKHCDQHQKRLSTFPTFRVVFGAVIGIGS